jgi:hypothetical protein
MRSAPTWKAQPVMCATKRRGPGCTGRQQAGAGEQDARLRVGQAEPARPVCGSCGDELGEAEGGSPTRWHGNTTTVWLSSLRSHRDHIPTRTPG